MNKRWSWPGIAMLAFLLLALAMGGVAKAPQRGPNAKEASEIDDFCRLYVKVIVPIEKREFGDLEACHRRGVE